MSEWMGDWLFRGLTGNREFAITVGLGILALVALVAVGLVAARAFGVRASGVRRTLIGWLWIIPPVALCLAAGRVGVIVGTALLSIYAFKEFARAVGLYRDWGLTCAVYLAIVGGAVLALIPDPRTAAHGWIGLFMALPAYAVGLLILIPIARNRSQGQLQNVSLSIFGFIYLGWMFLHFAMLANLDGGLGYLVFLLVAVPLNDIAAFTFGRLFGKRKLREAISPNKTWAGSLGAVAFSLALPWLLRPAFPHFETLDLILAGLIVGIGGQLGDLAISFIKRDLGVKDMGVTIPGHGGLLDRVDSLIFVAPLFFHMARWFHPVVS